VLQGEEESRCVALFHFCSRSGFFFDFSFRTDTLPVLAGEAKSYPSIKRPASLLTVIWKAASPMQPISESD
jgi:hypothetical protein